MHDVGAIVWVVLVVIGVVSSIVSNARRRTSVAPRAASPNPMAPKAMPPNVIAAYPTPPAPTPAAPPPARVTRVRPPQAPPPPRTTPATEHPLEVMRPASHRGSRLFAGRGALVRAVVAAEVLGKPLALRDEG